MAAQMEEMTQELIDMRLSIEGLEKERDFYFGKLRDIEVERSIGMYLGQSMFKYPIFFRLLFKNHQNHQILLLQRYWRFSMLLRKVLLFPMKMKLVKIMTSDDQDH